MLRTYFTPCGVFLVALALGSGGGFGCDRGKDQDTTAPTSRPAPQGGAAERGLPKGVGGKLYWDLAGDAAIARAMEDLGLLKEFSGPDGQLTADGRRKQRDMTDTFRRSLAVEMVFDSAEVKVISLSFVHNDPKMAEQLPNLLVKNHINDTAQRTINRLIGSKSFLEKQVAAGRAELAALRDLKAKFELEHANMMFESPSAIHSQILATQTRIDVLRGQQRTIESKLAKLEQAVTDYRAGQTAETRPVRRVLVRNEERDELARQVEDMKERLKMARETMKEKHPAIVTMRKQIQRLEESIAKMPGKIVKEEEIHTGTGDLPDRRDEYQKARQDLTAVQRTIEGLEDRLNALNKALANFGPARRDYEQMVQRIQEKEKAISEWNQRLRAVRTALAAELADKRTRMRVVQAAGAERIRTASGEAAWRGSTRFEIRREGTPEPAPVQPAGPGAGER